MPDDLPVGQLRPVERPPASPEPDPARVADRQEPSAVSGVSADGQARPVSILPARGVTRASRPEIQPPEDYHAFLKAKAALAPVSGFDVPADLFHPILKSHQRIISQWAVRGGRRAIFAAFGLGKTLMQLETVRVIQQQAGGRGLIVCPLGVRQEFIRDAAMVGLAPHFIRRIDEAEDPAGLYLTNYETIRDGKLDPAHFTVTSLDEAAVLRSFGGTKTFREFMRVFESVRYRFIATAVPDPNEYIELLAYAAYLGVMDVGQAKTRFFKRDSTKADALTLLSHKEHEFWLWIASWAMFVQRPSDLGPECSDEGYVLPPLTITWHEVPTDHAGALPERDGQGRLFRDATLGVSEAAREKRGSLDARLRTLMALRADAPEAHRILWHDLEDERRAIERVIPSVASVYGQQELEDREEIVRAFADGEIQELASKPVLLGAGTNLQRHCAWAIFLGIGFKFYEVIQAIHRIHRFLQDQPVRIDLIYSEAERSIRKRLEAKWARYDEQVARMSELLREHGLAQVALAHALHRTLGVTRQEASGPGYRLILHDCVEESRSLSDDSMDMILTSIPFATQYEYTPSFNDFGYTESTEHFWRQMDFLSPHLYRVLRPGRVMVIHVKDRVVPGGLTGLGFQTVSPLHAEAIGHYQRYGFAYMGMKTVVTDVVRENNQTYRLGWTEQCKDGTKMGWGMPEYLLLFRKPPSDGSRSYADVPVVKSKREYSLGRWQVDAGGFARSSGNRVLLPEDFDGIPHARIYKLFKRFNLDTVYDFEQHVSLAEALERQRRLPVTFQLLPPHSWHPDAWTDIARMRTLNMLQAAKGREMHLCPLQFDIVNRLVVEFSMPGETVLDPFAGLMTVPYCAVKLGRKAIGIELNPDYFLDGVRYVEEAARAATVPTLFDLIEAEAEP